MEARVAMSPGERKRAAEGERMTCKLTGYCVSVVTRSGSFIVATEPVAKRRIFGSAGLVEYCGVVIFLKHVLYTCYLSVL